MRNLKNVIGEYLSTSTDFAIQIVGGWGFGKTYYYRHTLEELISETPTLRDNRKRYKPIYISLFGLKSVEEIVTKIVIEFYQSKLFKTYLKDPDNRKKLQISESILKIGFRGFLAFRRLGNLNEYLTDIRKIGGHVLDSQELMICFDDLERKDSALNIKDLIGYINTLVDEGMKVLIISNEDLLLQSGDDYKSLKEKIIGTTLEFVPDTQDTLQSIIARRYDGFPAFQQYLRSEVDLLVAFVEAVGHNFRHVIYALDKWQHVYGLIKTEILDTDHDIGAKLEEQLPLIARLTLAVAAEYKASVLKYADIEQYRRMSTTLDELFAQAGVAKKKVEPEEKNKAQLLMEKYAITRQEYSLFDSIFAYVTGYQEFEPKTFVVEFTKHFKLDKGTVLPQFQLIQSLRYPNCFYLSDAEYRAKTLQLIKYANEGLFPVVEYLTVMHYAERMENILELDLDKVLIQLAAGLKTSLDNTPVNSELSFGQFEMSGQQVEISAWNKQLYTIGIQEIKAFRERRDRLKTEELCQLLTDQVQEFADKYQQDIDFKNKLTRNPFLRVIDRSRLSAMIVTADQEMLCFLQHFFHQRYHDHDILRQEYDFLTDFILIVKEQFDQHGEYHGGIMRNYLLKLLIGTLQEIDAKAIAEHLI